MGAPTDAIMIINDHGDAHCLLLLGVVRILLDGSWLFWYGKKELKRQISKNRFRAARLT